MVRYRKEWDRPEVEVNVTNPKVGRPINWATHTLKVAYKGRLALKPKVVTDLKWYIKKDFIPTIHLPYYHQLVQPPPPGAEQAENGDDDDDVPQEIIPDGPPT